MTIDKKYTGKSNGVSWEVDFANVPADKLDALKEGLIAQGLAIIFQRVKSGQPAADRKEHVKVVQEAMQNGTYNFSASGSRGPQMSYAQKAERSILDAWARESGMKAAAAITFAKKLDDAWQAVTRQAVLAQVQQSGMDEDAVKALDLPALIAANVETVKSAYADTIAKKAAELELADKKAEFGIQVAGIVLQAPPAGDTGDTNEPDPESTDESETAQDAN